MVFTSTNPPSGYYVYAYIRASDLTPYYIGKGYKNRAWSKNHLISLPKNKNNIVILEHNLTEIGALAIERRMILWYGRKDMKTGILRNKTDGGDGTSGAIQSETTIEKRRKSMIGKPSLLKGKKQSTEHIKKAADSRRGCKQSKESNEKRSKAHTGKKHTSEHIKNAALAKRGIKQSNEHKLKRSIAQKGKHWWNDGKKSYFTKDCPINCVKGRLSSTW